MSQRNVSLPVSLVRKPEKHSMRVGDCVDSDRDKYHKRRTVVCVPIWPVMVPIKSVMAHLARRGFQHCVVYCVLPPMLVYFAVMRPDLHFLQCSQSYHQFVTKHTLMSFITGLGCFVSWGNCNDQTCFLFWMLSLVSQLLLPR